MSGARAVSAVAAVPRLVLIGLIRAYQVTVSPLLGPRCKYYPSCSHYGLEAVRRHGAVTGVVLAAWRVLRCNPWSHGGVDDVPHAGEPLFRRHTHTSPDADASLTSI
ncbi:membrane protein insertion efficiency factor YidD [Demequina sp. NBRC 110053]|uniref:membrane protein insertion efficiency factor YidD n=1 Tax=Demequina sp. NBRC 110053 TaxID=1570342 RepID=UPI000A066A61|nr:membrane protein insertion efficiency factor YidD [Demequina sp. NBRC 110053]